jgi:hypothetical protein
LGFICLALFIGIWHGFPFTNTVADEMYFSGGVLRSMEHHTILPLPLDVPYGTVTFYVSYIFISFGLLVLFIFNHFNIDVLKFFVIQYPFIVYGFARLVSFSLAIFSLVTLNYVFKQYISDYRVRLTVIFLLFTNILVNVVFHTSKVWVLSTVLLVCSFYFLTELFTTLHHKKRNIFLSVVLAFLSFSNFPIMGISLICLPIIIYSFWQNNDLRKTILGSVIVGILLFFGLTLSNFSGIKAQVSSILFDYTFSLQAMQENMGFLASLFSHAKKLIVTFPLLLGMALYVGISSKLQRRKMFFLSVTYFLLYFLVLAVVDRWSISGNSSLRYLFPLPFFLLFIIASFEITWKKIWFALGFLSFVFIIPTLYYLSVPTTNYKLVTYLTQNFGASGNIIFVNHAGGDVFLPRNKMSYLLLQESKCISRCKATIEYNLESGFRPVVLDEQTDLSKVSYVDKQVYYIEKDMSVDKNLKLVQSFGNSKIDSNYYSLDNAGNYFDLSYFSIKRFGQNLYVFKALN